MRLILIALILFLFQSVSAQQKFTLSGYVRDSLSGETLIGATITVTHSGGTTGVSSNQYGYYSITLPAGSYSVTSTYVGYQAVQLRVKLDRNLSFNMLLVPKSSTNTEVIVYSRRR